MMIAMSVLMIDDTDCRLERMGEEVNKAVGGRRSFILHMAYISQGRWR